MKKFTKQEILELYGQVTLGEISFSQMVEIMNERVSEMVSDAGKPCVEDIPRKFKKGDKVRIKKGVSSETHGCVYPYFTDFLSQYMGKVMTVEKYITNNIGEYVTTCEAKEGNHPFGFSEDWLEPYEELKKGDLAIFWDDDRRYAALKFYEKSNESDGRIWHKDSFGFNWDNAIKFESVEQFERLINGEI